MQIDYKELLRKYIFFIGRLEGSSFIDELSTSSEDEFSESYFTKMEVLELQRIDQELLLAKENS